MIAMTTVGTSILEYVKSETSRVEELIDELDNKPVSKMDEYGSQVSSLSEIIKKLFAGDRDYRVRIAESAELSCFEKIKKQYPEDTAWDVRLLCSDTIHSHICADVIAGALDENYKVETIEKLNLTDAKTFQRDGLTNLFKKLRDPTTRPPSLYKNTLLETRVIYNITGGYKALIPYMTIFAQMSRAPIYYLFENTDTLIKIPQLPVTVDFERLIPHKSFLLDLRNNFINTYQFSAYAESNDNILASCIDDSESDNICLNTIGELFLNEVEQGTTLKVYNNFCNERNPSVRRNILDAVHELVDGIKRGIAGNSRLPEWTDHYINHIQSTTPYGFFIYKHQSPQIRLAYNYDYDESVLTLFNFKFIKTPRDDEEYYKKENEFFQTVLKTKDETPSMEIEL